MDKFLYEKMNVLQKRLEEGDKTVYSDIGDCIIEECKPICSNRELPFSKLFPPTNAYVNGIVFYYTKEDGNLADYIEWFARMCVDCFLIESKEEDNFVKNTHKEKEYRAMENIFPIERAVIKVYLKLKEKDYDKIAEELKWTGKYGKKAIKMAFDKYEKELSAIE